MIFEFGGITIKIISERKLEQTPTMYRFIKKTEIGNVDLTIELTWDWNDTLLPTSKAVLLGEDLLQEYYKENEVWFCESKGGKAPVTCTSYDDNLTWMKCAINEKPFIEPPRTIDKIFTLLPMRAVFLHFHTLFLHASQISFHGKGIVFAAPSGTGKTTQAKLWEKYMKASIVCNDRTLIKKEYNVWQTYGYPIDGSEPVRSNEINQLGCIVLLKQGQTNKVEKLKISQAVCQLMEQMVIDCWNYQARMCAMNLLLEMLRDIPVYQLVCTPDFSAVKILRDRLIKEGLINDDNDYETPL